MEKEGLMHTDPLVQHSGTNNSPGYGSPTSDRSLGTPAAPSSSKETRSFLPKEPGQLRDLVAVFILMGCCVGVGFGLQATFQGAKARGVFSDLCTEEERHAVAVNGTDADGTWCDAQTDAMAVVTDAVFSFVNAISWFDGLTVDAVGGRRAIFGFASLWAVSTCAAGISFTQGYVWAACMLMGVWGIEGSMLSILVFHMRIVCRERPALYNFWSGGFTSLWDLGTFASIPVGHFWIRETTMVPIELTYVAIAFVFATPLLLWLIYFSRKHRNQTEIADGLHWQMENAPLPLAGESVNDKEGEDDGTQPQEVKLTASKALCMTLKKTKSDCIRLVKNGTFWLLTLQAITTVTLASFVIATLGVSLKGLGADSEQISQGRFIFAYFRAGSGLFYFVPSIIASRFGVLRGMTYTEAFLALNAALVFVVIAVLKPDSYSVVRTLFLMLVFTFWRSLSFSVLNTLLLERFRVDFPDSMGFIYGFVYSIGGLTSLLVGGVTTSYATRDPSTFYWLLGGFAGLTATIHIIVAFKFFRQLKAGRGFSNIVLDAKP